MWRSSRGRTTLIAVLTAVSIAAVLPSLTDNLPDTWKKMPKIHLGLDLQGGVFLRLAVEIEKAIENTTLRYADDARAPIVGGMSRAEVGAIGASAVGRGGETIRTRIDQFGVREPQIVAEGED